MSLRNRWAGALAALVVALVVGAPTAQAQVKPFKVVGSGEGAHGLPLPGQDPREHTSVGQATHLGRYSGAGMVQTDWAVILPDGSFVGEFGSGAPFVFTAANGDQLVTNYGRTDLGAEEPGSVVLTPTGDGRYTAFWIAEFVVDPDDSTGKFNGVTGSWIMYAWSEPFVLGSDDPIAYSWEGEGSLTFPKKK